MGYAKSFDRWAKTIGALDAEAILKLLPELKDDIQDNDDYAEILAHSKSSKILLDFVSKNKEYHIATYSVDDLPDDSMQYVYHNEYHVVNRMSYYLCNGYKGQYSFSENSED